MIFCTIFYCRFLTNKRRYHILKDSQFQINIICIWDFFNKKNARHSCFHSCYLVYSLSEKHYLLWSFTLTKAFCNVTSNYVCFSLQKPSRCLWTFICRRGACSWRESFNLLQACRTLQHSPATCHEKRTLFDWLKFSAIVIIFCHYLSFVLEIIGWLYSCWRSSLIIFLSHLKILVLW